MSVEGLLDAAQPVGALVGGVPVLGVDGLLDDAAFIAAHDFHLSISDPDGKIRLADGLAEKPAGIISIVHPEAIVSSSAEITPGAFINAGAVVNAQAHIGAHAIVNTRASVDHGCRIGAAAHVAPGVTICGDVIVEDGAQIGPGAVIGSGVSIGAKAIIGAGAVVLSDVAPGSRVWGVPARPAVG